ncbi:hypothetical protein [Streptomyces lydicus]|uniref:hypothetical protein n=1 Tax=Streptomyces lydicus TaxID=47763 RepID=UPI0037B18A6B
MTMEDLIKVGAPALPAGMFYRVRRLLGTALLVQVRRRRRLVGSEEMASTVVFPGLHESGTAAVVDGCTRAAQRLAERDEDRRRFHDATFFIGDHTTKEKQ